MTLTSYKFRSVVTVDFEKIPVVVGRIVSRETIEIDGKPRLAVNIDSRSGLYRVFETFQLADAFKAAADGDGILIHYLLTKTTRTAGRRLKQFNVQVFEWPKDGVLPQEIAEYGDDHGRVTSYAAPAPPSSAPSR